MELVISVHWQIRLLYKRLLMLLKPQESKTIFNSDVGKHICRQADAVFQTNEKISINGNFEKSTPESKR